MLASGTFEVKDATANGHVAWGPTIFATVIAFAIGYAVIAWFMKFISHKSFMPFVWYRIALGIVIIALVSTGGLSPHAAESAGLSGPVRGPTAHHPSGARAVRPGRASAQGSGSIRAPLAT